MIYDEQLSNNVSLSRILDRFIEDGETSSVIVNFLKKYDDNFVDIASRSYFIDRIFCSDYLVNCSFDDTHYLLSHLEDIDFLNAMYCSWQCLLLASAKREYSFLKPQALAYINANQTENPYLRHPHAGYGYSDIKLIDIDFILNGFCPELAFNAFTPDELEKFMNGGAHSLIATRLFQCDCFEACSNLHQYVIIKNLNKIPNGIAYKLVLQLLVSGIEPEKKLEVLKQGGDSIMLSANSKLFFDSNIELFNILDKAKNYPSIAIQMVLNGEDAIADSIMYLLCKHKYKVLAEMAEIDATTMENNFPIVDLISYMKHNTCLIDIDKHNTKQEKYAA